MSKTGGPLVEVAYRYLGSFGEALPVGLRVHWRELLKDRLIESKDRYFEHPHAQPLAHVPRWAVESLHDGSSRLPTEVLHDFVGASAVGYHAIRLQDDLMDEGKGNPIVVMLLSTAAFAHAESLIGCHVHDERFWVQYSQIMTGYAEAMRFEQSLRAEPELYDEIAFDRVLERSRPLAIPGLAVLAACDAWSQAVPFTKMIDHATKAIQIVNDLIDAADDLERGDHTWVLTTLRAHVQPQAFEKTMLAQFDAIVQRARNELVAAGNIARDLGTASAAAWASSAENGLTKLQTEFWTEAFRPHAQVAED